MNRTTSVSLQIAFFIFMIIGLSLFFGAYALIVPAVLGYIWWKGFANTFCMNSVIQILFGY